MHLLLALCLAAEPEPSFDVHAAKSAPARGQVIRLEKDWATTWRADPHFSVSGAELISLRQHGAVLPTLPVTAQVVFANGDRVPGKVLTIADEKVRLHAQLTDYTATPADPQPLLMPLSSLAVIWFVPEPESSTIDVARVLRERRRKDVVIMHNGDMRYGVVRSLAADGNLRLQEDGGERAISASQIHAIAFNTDLVRTLKPRGVYARLVLRNGTRLALAAAIGDAVTLNGRTLFGAEVAIPWQQIVALDVLQGAGVYLSDLKPKSYSHTPFLGVPWPYALDRSVVGGELRVGGQCFDKGIGLHSESRISYALNGSFRRFEALVGLDERTGLGGSVRVRVLVDGQEKAAGAELTSATGPRPLRIDVGGAKELILVVEFGAGGDVRDHVNWADARLIK